MKFALPKYVLFAFGGLAFVATSIAATYQLPGYKDSLFAYAKVLQSEDQGGYRVVDYQELRDINGRDQVPEKRVKSQYVSLAANQDQRDLKLRTGAGEIAHVAVGKTSGARMITIYVHGQGGNRRQGSNDWTFGGNFNRIKNLMAANGGLYLVPDVRDFGPTGVARIGSLIDHYARQSPGAPVFVACGSAGGAICYGVANAPATVRWLSGLIMLGSFWQDDFIGSPAFRKNVPIFFGQGSRDPVFAIDKMEAFYHRIRDKSDGYPVMFVRFESGSHGTPIRMTDWRETLNWMLMRRP